MTNIFIIYHSGTIRTLEKYIYVPEIITFQRIWFGQFDNSRKEILSGGKGVQLGRSINDV